MTFKLVLFDLDGTLLDTSLDMIGAVNDLRQSLNLPAVPISKLRNQVSNGAVAMIRHGFDMDPEHPDFADLRQRFLDVYSQRVAAETRPFEGMDALLDLLERQGIAWGVVTNKPAWLTDPLMLALGLSSRAACVVSGDTTTKRKPDPEPLFHAASLAGISPSESVYVGDALRDIEAGRNAGMPTYLAAWGFIEPTEDLQTWQADFIADSPSHLAELLLG